MKHLKLFEAFGSPLLNLENNVDLHLTKIIKNNFDKGDSILEISCGNAADSIYLKEAGYDITCTELDDGYLKNAKENNLNCIKHNTKEKFPFSDNKFDLIYCRLGLHYFKEDELYKIFSELQRIGKNLLITIKVESDSFNTGKVIIPVEKWKNIITEYFNIKTFKVKKGLLYDKESKWLEVFCEKK